MQSKAQPSAETGAGTIVSNVGHLQTAEAPDLDAVKRLRAQFALPFATAPAEQQMSGRLDNNCRTDLLALLPLCTNVELQTAWQPNAFLNVTCLLPGK